MESVHVSIRIMQRERDKESILMADTKINKSNE